MHVVVAVVDPLSKFADGFGQDSGCINSCHNHLYLEKFLSKY